MRNRDNDNKKEGRTVKDQEGEERWELMQVEESEQGGQEKKSNGEIEKEKRREQACKKRWKEQTENGEIILTEKN